MNKTRLRYLFLLGLCFGLLPLCAQKGNILVLRDSLTGKDSILHWVSFVKDTPHNLQYGITVDIGKLSLIKLTPPQVPLYREGKTTYLSRTLQSQGTQRQVFLPRILWQPGDLLSLFLFINDQNRKEYYYQFKSEKEVLPLAITTDGRTKSALEDYLLSFPVARQDAQVQAYIRKMKPTPRSYRSRQLICLSNNSNYLPAFRWGVLAGTGFSQLEMENGYRFDKQWQWYAGAFADIPLGQKGVSFHPEVSFLKVSALRLSTADFNKDMAYNRTDLCLPLLLRYTVKAIHGKILPYLQVGPQLGLRLKGDLETLPYLTDENGYAQLTDRNRIVNKNWLTSGMAGLGVEIKLRPNHSLFVDARYVMNMTSDSYSFQAKGWFATAAYNL